MAIPASDLESVVTQRQLREGGKLERKRLTMKRVLMTQSGFVTIVPDAPAVIAATMCAIGSSRFPKSSQKHAESALVLHDDEKMRVESSHKQQEQQRKEMGSDTPRREIYLDSVSSIPSLPPRHVNARAKGIRIEGSSEV